MNSSAQQWRQGMDAAKAECPGASIGGSTASIRITQRGVEIYDGHGFTLSIADESALGMAAWIQDTCGTKESQAIQGGPAADTPKSEINFCLNLYGLSEDEYDVCAAAVRQILETMREAKKTEKHIAYAWRDDPKQNDPAQHLDAAAGHAIRCARILRQYIPTDGEYHAAKVLTRAALAVAIFEAKKG